MREQIWLDPGTCPICILPLDIPVGAIGNTVPLILPIKNAVALLSQPIKVAGSPNIMIEGIDIIDFAGVKLVQPSGPTQILKLHFEHDEFINVAKGASVLCQTETQSIIGDADPAKGSTAKTRIPRLNSAQAEAYLLLLEAQPKRTRNFTRYINAL